MKTTAARLAAIVAAALWASLGCERATTPDTAPGVSRRLAVQRGALLSEVRHEIRFVLPLGSDERIEGHETLRFYLGAAGAESLNRNRDYLYTLFVPDRARFAYPSFDQPDLKARYSLTLDVPSGWQDVANSPLVSRETRGERSLLRFVTTPGALRHEAAGAADRRRRHA